MTRGSAVDHETTPPWEESLRSPEEERARFGTILRKAYEDVLIEPVPDVFADLLRRLD